MCSFHLGPDVFSITDYVLVLGYNPKTLWEKLNERPGTAAIEADQQRAQEQRQYPSILERTFQPMRSMLSAN